VSTLNKPFFVLVFRSLTLNIWIDWTGKFRKNGKTNLYSSSVSYLPVFFLPNSTRKKKIKKNHQILVFLKKQNKQNMFINTKYRPYRRFIPILLASSFVVFFLIPHFLKKYHYLGSFHRIFLLFDLVYSSLHKSIFSILISTIIWKYHFFPHIDPFITFLIKTPHIFTFNNCYFEKIIKNINLIDANITPLEFYRGPLAPKEVLAVKPENVRSVVSFSTFAGR